MGLVISGDFHIGSYRNGPEINGVNGRLLDIKARMWEILDFMKGLLERQESFAFVMLGDVFKDKHPSIPEMTVFAEFLSELKRMQVVSYFFPGNHDASKVVGQPHALAPFIPLQGGSSLGIVDTPSQVKLVSLSGQTGWLFPYTWHSQDEPLKKFLEYGKEEDIVFLHGTIEGGAMNKLVDYELFDEDVIKYDTVKKFRGVFAGHLHDAQHFKNVWYPGSIERLAFGDELSPKSFLYVDAKGKELDVKTIPLNARKMVSMGYAQLPELRAGRFSVKDAIVRITGIEKGEIQSTRKALMEAGCYYIAGAHSADQAVNELPKATGINIAEFIRRYAEKTGYKGDVNAATQIILDTVGNQS